MNNKKISSSLENILHNIVETDYATGHWPDCFNQIMARLQTQDEANIILGLRCLKELVRAFQYEIGKEQKVLMEVCQQAYPQLENVMNFIVQNTGSPNQFKIMKLVAKIFYMSNHLKLQPLLMVNGRLGVWVNYFVTILEYQQDPSSELVMQTASAQQIDMLDKSDWWKLKGICSKISVKLF